MAGKGLKCFLYSRAVANAKSEQCTKIKEAPLAYSSQNLLHTVDFFFQLSFFYRIVTLPMFVFTKTQKPCLKPI